MIDHDEVDRLGEINARGMFQTYTSLLCIKGTNNKGIWTDVCLNLFFIMSLITSTDYIYYRLCLEMASV